MARVSGIALIVVGLLWPVLTLPESRTSTAIAALLPAAALPAPVPLALTPPMGWNGFNRFYHDVNEARVEAQARAIVTSGMRAAGYQYVNLDGGWDLMQRGPRGELQPNPTRFPNGIKPVADYVHSLGLKFGIYTSAGLTNCAHTTAGSYGHYLQDAADFAAWGVDYIKLDWCFIPYGEYPGISHQRVSQMLAAEMADAIDASGRQMLYDVNDWADYNPGAWARGLAHMWRTTRDSADHYWSLLLNFKFTVGLYKMAGPGGWNDPDMLEIGNGGMTANEYRSQFSLWSVMAAPLIAGNDVTAMSEVTRSILTNRAVIAVDQDRLGQQGRPVWASAGRWVIAKLLVSGAVAVVLFNSTNEPANISTTAAQIGLARTNSYALVDLWSHNRSETAGLITARVPAHGVVMYEVSAVQPDDR